MRVWFQSRQTYLLFTLQSIPVQVALSERGSSHTCWHTLDLQFTSELRIRIIIWASHIVAVKKDGAGGKMKHLQQARLLQWPCLLQVSLDMLYSQLALLNLTKWILLFKELGREDTLIFGVKCGPLFGSLFEKDTHISSEVPALSGLRIQAKFQTTHSWF